MSPWKRLLLSTALAAVLAPAAHAQLGGRPFEVSAGAGITNFDSRDQIKDAAAFTGSFGWRWTNFLSLEGSFTGSKTKLDRDGSPDHEWSYSALDLRWNLRDPGERATPYLLTGVGMGRSLNDVDGLARTGAPSLGVGFLKSMFGPRTYLRVQARTISFREAGAQESSHHIEATAAIHWILGGKAKDQDLDGVSNWDDKCANTPIGAKVEKNGCPIDSDRDSVFDGLDKCEGTPAGCRVDKNGCPMDADGDGVCDGLDLCASTPAGAKVDAKGCPMDTDGDGVFDGLDKCENSAKGCAVDTAGCPIDTDGDGVCDGLDQCPNTLAEYKADSSGCPIEVSEREVELLDTGMIRLENINFETGKAVLKPESDAVLASIAAILLQYPALKIEIGGHTDNTGTKAKNQKLSESRAAAVKTWLTSRYPTLDVAMYTSKGYGPDMPVASNGTALGRSKNRRVEFKVTNTEALHFEREKRGFLRKDSAAPADTTKH